MRSEDIRAISIVLTTARSEGLNANRIILLSGCDEERELVMRLWPYATVTALSESDWDLSGPHPSAWCGFDLAVACNTFMCSKDPQLWLDNIALTCRHVLIQDLAVAQRCHDRHLSPDTGDVARYSVTSCGVLGETDPGHRVFDISEAGYHIIDCIRYGIEDQHSVKFAVLIDLTRKMNVDA